MLTSFPHETHHGIFLYDAFCGGGATPQSMIIFFGFGHVALLGGVFFLQITHTTQHSHTRSSTLNHTHIVAPFSLGDSTSTHSLPTIQLTPPLSHRPMIPPEFFVSVGRLGNHVDVFFDSLFFMLRNCYGRLYGRRGVTSLGWIAIIRRREDILLLGTGDCIPVLGYLASVTQAPSEKLLLHTPHMPGFGT